MSAIPAALTEIPRWVLWRTIIRNGKSTKEPLAASTGRRAAVNRPGDFADYASATAAHARRVGQAEGVGIVLGVLDGEHVLAGLDLDTSLRDGVLAEWARPFIQALNTYGEISPSGTGLKLFFRVHRDDLPALRRQLELADNEHGRKRTFGQATNGAATNGAAHPPAAEVYLDLRYFTVTANRWHECAEDLAIVPAERLATLASLIGPRPKSGRRGADADNSLLARIRHAGMSDDLLRRRWDGDIDGMADRSRSALAFAIGRLLKKHGFGREEVAWALRANAHTAEWANGVDARQFDRVWERAGEDHEQAEDEPPGEPDLGVLRPLRRPAPVLPLAHFGEHWGPWITRAAEAASCPVDYIAAPLLAAASTLIGNARWPRAWDGWEEPPHLWIGAVGDSGDGKSPGSDALFRHVLPEIERRMCADFPDRLREWQTSAELAQAKQQVWKGEVGEALRLKTAPPTRPLDADAGPEPQAPRLRQNDVTIEKTALLLATSAPKGMLMVRDELAGFLLGMSAYSDAARPFWLEAYGGRPYRVERVKNAEPIEVPRLAVAWFGGIQPERLAGVMDEVDDGLLARFVWCWPEPIAFDRATRAPEIEFAIRSLDRLRLLDLGSTAEGRAVPIMVPLAAPAAEQLVAFARAMQQRKEPAIGLLRSAHGKARGLALRVALIFEFLWWCGRDDYEGPPGAVGDDAMRAAIGWVESYVLPMAERVYGDAACTKADRGIVTLARWLAAQKPLPAEVHVRHMQREVRLPGLTTAELIHGACQGLVEAGWLSPRRRGGGPGSRRRESYPLNPLLRHVLTP